MEQTAPGKLIIVSGPSGAGKTTVLRRVFETCRAPLVASVSATTRAPREGEIDGVDYHFLSREEFARRRAAGEFLECCEVYSQGDWYGTLRGEVAPSLAAGKWVVLEIDVQGTLAVLAHYPQAVTIFLTPASPEDLQRRLKGRGTEGPEALARRLEVARRELTFADRYRYRVVNEDVARAAAEICDILTKPGDRQ
jgi:guanylate kinase